MSILLPIAAKIIDSALAKLPGDAELGDLLIDTALHILKKAVAMTSQPWFLPWDSVSFP